MASVDGQDRVCECLYKIIYIPHYMAHHPSQVGRLIQEEQLSIYRRQLEFSRANIRVDDLIDDRDKLLVRQLFNDAEMIFSSVASELEYRSRGQAVLQVKHDCKKVEKLVKRILEHHHDGRLQAIQTDQMIQTRKGIDDLPTINTILHIFRYRDYASEVNSRVSAPLQAVKGELEQPRLPVRSSRRSTSRPRKQVTNSQRDALPDVTRGARVAESVVDRQPVDQVTRKVAAMELTTRQSSGSVTRSRASTSKTATVKHHVGASRSPTGSNANLRQAKSVGAQSRPGKVVRGSPEPAPGPTVVRDSIDSRSKSDRSSRDARVTSSKRAQTRNVERQVAPVEQSSPAICSAQQRETTSGSMNADTGSGQTSSTGVHESMPQTRRSSTGGYSDKSGANRSGSTETVSNDRCASDRLQIRAITNHRVYKSGKFMFCVEIESSFGSPRWLPAERVISEDRLKVLAYLLNIKRAGGARGASTRAYYALHSSVKRTLAGVLRREDGDPDMGVTQKDIGSKRKLVQPNSENPFPNCPGDTAEENEIAEVLAHSLAVQYSFYIKFKNYHDAYWIYYTELDSLNYQPLQEYLTEFGLKSYVKYLMLIDKDKDFAAKVLRHGHLADHTYMPQPALAKSETVVSFVKELNELGPDKQAQVHLIVARGYCRDQLCFLVKLQNSYRLYWMDGRLAIALGRVEVLRCVMKIRREINQKAWLKLVSSGPYLFEDVLKIQENDPTDLGITPDRIGRESALQQPSPDNPFPGCPGRTLDDNTVAQLISHHIKTNQVSFYVVFKRFHDAYWVNSKTVSQLPGSESLKHYCQELDHPIRTKMVSIDSGLERFF